MKVTYFYRPKNESANSIEAVFDIIKKSMPSDVWHTDFICTQKFKRFQSYFKARHFQGDINHITGDIHIIALFLKSKKTVVTIHDLGPIDRGFGGSVIKRKLFKFFWLTLPFKKVEQITTISDFTKRKIIETCKINPDKIVVIPNPAPLDFYYCPYTFNVTNPIILQIGSDDTKNLNRLIEAIKGTSFQLLLLRSPDDSIKKKLDAYNISYEWRFNLTREEVFECYKKCDVLFFASEYEGFGVPILEANAVGRPVVTSNIASMPYVAGDAAILVDPYNVEEIKKALKEIKDNAHLREQLIERGIQNVKRFSPEEIAKKYYSVYKTILNQ
ncbi:glycosyltransferase family 1 protein [Flavobacterium sp. NG2]|uniref:glycosyltransferase family 4 protein n=1 Tax=Flavobacterium sp. NG2 TaxID=3097547 RepID=UPI002A8056D4|nr:glycosyltransferase family 1 protein [Flavobacterium sp. NG2]WPR71647.1 glycosyltransferase family 1 protein [Flavobacterium sp. NG2]